MQAVNIRYCIYSVQMFAPKIIGMQLRETLLICVSMICASSRDYVDKREEVRQSREDRFVP